jgi:hypothetical protein
MKKQYVFPMRNILPPILYISVIDAIVKKHVILNMGSMGLTEIILSEDRVKQLRECGDWRKL